MNRREEDVHRQDKKVLHGCGTATILRAGTG